MINYAVLASVCVHILVQQRHAAVCLDLQREQTFNSLRVVDPIQGQHDDLQNKFVNILHSLKLET